VALQLALNCRSGERRELHTAAGVEPLDRLEEPDECYLLQIVSVDASVPETAGEEVRESRVLFNEFVAKTTLSVAAVEGKPLVDAVRFRVSVRTASTLGSW